MVRIEQAVLTLSTEQTKYVDRYLAAGEERERRLLYSIYCHEPSARPVSIRHALRPRSCPQENSMIMSLTGARAP